MLLHLLRMRNKHFVRVAFLHWSVKPLCANLIITVAVPILYHRMLLTLLEVSRGLKWIPAWKGNVMAYQHVFIEDGPVEIGIQTQLHPRMHEWVRVLTKRHWMALECTSLTSYLLGQSLLDKRSYDWVYRHLMMVFAPIQQSPAAHGRHSRRCVSELPQRCPGGRHEQSEN